MIYLFGESSRGCKQEILNLKLNLQIISDLGKMFSNVWEVDIFLSKSQNIRLPFRKISVQIVCSFQVSYFRINGFFY